jgi:murein DD-endopeptidase MepM/ murein hydrolase activator NlpD
VTTTEGLRLRPQPNTSQPELTTLAYNTVVEVIARVQGQDIMGNTEWFNVRHNSREGYISAYFSECVADPAPPPPVSADPLAFYLPLQCGSRARISQGNGGNTSHTGRTQYAFDFSIGLNTPVVAMAPGEVVAIFDQTGPGDACYGGGDSSCSSAANYVILRHADGNRTSYVHLNRVDVAVGAQVSRGQQVGLSGSTGYSTGPHLHAERQQSCSSRYCQTIPLSFEDVGGNGVPTSGETVTSGNCE